jgi:hypothetical protein
MFMNKKSKRLIINLFIAIFISSSFIFLCYMFAPCWFRNRTIYFIETLQNGNVDNGSVSSSGSASSVELNQINIDIRPEKETLILLGDSILANQQYVPKGKSVFDYLSDTTSAFNIVMFAKDNYTINDVYFQLADLPISYNSKDTTIVLSVGGNNFLTGTTYHTATTEYMFLIEQIKDRFPDCKLYLVNLYQPFDPLLLQIYKTIISKWNNFLKEIVKKGLADGIVDIASVVTDPNDLVYKIEPSVIGGEKIAGAIVQTVSGDP